MSTQHTAPLNGIRVLSLALNLPGPAALMRCREMGATCTKLEPPSRGGHSADPMSHYNAQAYAELHEGIDVIHADLKQESGQHALHAALAQTDVLITSFRPSALRKLGLSWEPLSLRYPRLCWVEIVGAPGDRAEEPGHDLTYLAESDLVTGLELPATLFADMGGALMTSEAVLAGLMARSRTGHGHHHVVALSSAAQWLAIPRRWGMTQPDGAVGGAHAGYRVYRCADGRVALAALEPHFATALCTAAGVPMVSPDTLTHPQTREAIAAFLLGKTRRELERLAAEKDIPLHTLDA